MKKLFFFVLVTLFHLLANAETYNVVIDGIKYELTNVSKSGSVYTNAEVIANSYYGDIVIPVSVTYNELEYSVSSIGNSAFSGCSGLISITIPESVTVIGDNAFDGCSSLSSIAIPNSVTSIGNSAFSGCRGLTSIAIPESVTVIDESVFDGCSSLSSIAIPNSVTSIGNSAFSGCRGLTSITIPESVTVIGDNAFDGCSSLASIAIPNSVTSIGSNAFKNCSSLNSVIIGNGVTRISYGIFDNCKALTSVKIPNSASSIGRHAFEGCSSLTSITIPNRVARIESYAFYGCSGLEKVIVPDIAAWCKIIFGLEGTTIGSNPLSLAHHLYSDESTEVKNLVIPNSVKSIHSNAFEGCAGLTSITIPNSVTSIGNNAFKNCTGLTSITIPNSVTSIGNNAFENCTGLTSITIPNSVISIGSSAFKKCTGLTSVTIPNGVISIGSNAFSGCSGLASVTIPNSVTSIGEAAFWGCKGLTQASIGSGSIDKRSFEGCNSLTSLTIGNGVESIGQSAFKGCSSLNSVTMGTGIKTIGGSAFASCPELTDFYCYAENVPNTSSTAFEDSYIEYATLHVPDVSVNLYKQASPWNNFKEIVPTTVKTYILTYIVDNEVYKTYEVDYGSAITPEPEPTKDGYTFSGWSEIPDIMPPYDVTVIGSFIPNEPIEQCSIPSIAFVEGKLIFDSETEDAEFHYEIKVEDAKEGVGSEVTLSSAYEILVYASKEGYNDSEMNTATLYWISVDSTITGMIENEMRVNTNAILVQNTGGEITISGVADDDNVFIYNISGQLIAQGRVSGNHVEIGTSLSCGDICIIKIGGKSVKYLLK